MSITPFTIFVFFTIVLVCLFLYLWSVYNSFIITRNQVKTDLSDINIQIKRKADLIDSLISIVREYAKHEKETFENVTQARSVLNASKNVDESAKAENMLTQTLRSLFAVVENYPELKASDNFKQLRDDLKETENLIARYREEYNRSVQKFNNLIQTFPNVLFSSLFGFREELLYQIS